MKYLKTYDKLFEASQKLTQRLTQDQLDYLGIHTEEEADGGSWKINPSTGLIDIEGDFSVSFGNAIDLFDIKFGTITGNFRCGRNKITTLEGGPTKVGKSFTCEFNYLTSLVGAPEEVKENFLCTHNRLDTLEGAPMLVGGEFICDFFECPEGEWSMAWAAENIDKYPILETIADLKTLQDMINKNPSKMVIELKSSWNKLKKNPKYKSLKFPDRFKKDITLTSDLADLGL